MNFETAYAAVLLSLASGCFLIVFSPAFPTLLGLLSIFSYEFLKRAQETHQQGQRFVLLRFCSQIYRKTLDRKLLRIVSIFQTILIVLCFLGTGFYIYAFGICVFPQWAIPLTKMRVESCTFLGGKIQINHQYLLQDINDCSKVGDYVYYCVKDTKKVENEPCVFAQGTRVNASTLVLSGSMIVTNIVVFVIGVVNVFRTLWLTVSKESEEEAP